MILADFLLPGSGSVSLKRIRIRLTKMKRIRIQNTEKNSVKYNKIYFCLNVLNYFYPYKTEIKCLRRRLVKYKIE